MNKIAFIGSNELLLDRAKQLKLSVVLIHKAQEVTDRSRALADQCLLLDYGDHNNLDCMVSFLKHHKVQAIVTLREDALISAALLNKELGLGWENELVITQKLKDKVAMREFIAAKSYSVPFFSITHRKELIDLYNQIKAPIITKPKSGVGSQNVSKVESWSDIAQIDCSSPLIAEKFIHGIEYSVESFSCNTQHNILAITKKMLYQTADSKFVEQRHIIGEEIPANVNALIHDTVIQFLCDMNVENGAYHTEVIVDGGSCFIIESHNRVGGDSIPDLVY